MGCTLFTDPISQPNLSPLTVPEPGIQSQVTNQRLECSNCESVCPSLCSFTRIPRAHQLNRVYDWVIIYFYDDHHREGQHTVVTETHGRLAGKRVERGREVECEACYSDVAGR